MGEDGEREGKSSKVDQVERKVKERLLKTKASTHTQTVEAFLS